MIYNLTPYLFSPTISSLKNYIKLPFSSIDLTRMIILFIFYFVKPFIFKKSKIIVKIFKIKKTTDIFRSNLYILFQKYFF
jgi:hypothetical protein